MDNMLLAKDPLNLITNTACYHKIRLPHKTQESAHFHLQPYDAVENKYQSCQLVCIKYEFL